MNTTWHSLIWKEWHEHKWKLLSITAVLLSATSLSIVMEDVDKLGLAFGMLLMCIIPLAVFVGLGAAANEQSRGTLAYLQAQPVRLWQVGTVKLVLSLATVMVPVAITALSIGLWRIALDWWGAEYADRVLASDAGSINTGNFFVDIAIYGMLLAGSLVIWTAAAGVNRKDEVSAGARALAMILGWSAIVWLFCWLAYEAGLDLGENSKWGVATALSVTPAFLVVLGPGFTAAEMFAGAIISVVVHLLFAVYFVRRFGQTMERPIVSPKVAERDARRLDWLNSPRRSPLAATVWKQYRESIPIAVVGLAAIVGTATVIYVADGNSPASAPFGEMYFGAAVSLGFCIALVVGIGVALQDMGPQLNTFWRSRPINGGTWFWTKFLTGLVVVISAIYLPQLFIAVTTGFADRDYWQAMSVVVTLHITTYAAAVAVTCLVRHAVYAAILSIGALIASIAAAWVAYSLPIWLGLAKAAPDERVMVDDTVELTIVLAGLIACSAISIVTGWLAMRNDWGWKARY